MSSLLRRYADMQKISQFVGRGRGNRLVNGAVEGNLNWQPAKNLCKFFNQRCERFMSLCGEERPRQAGRKTRRATRGCRVRVSANRRFCVCQALTTTATTMAVSRLQFARQQCESNQSQSSNTISQICTSMCRQLVCVVECVIVCVCACYALLRQLPGTFAIA